MKPDRYPEVTLPEKYERACEDRDGWQRRADAAEALVGRMRSMLTRLNAAWDMPMDEVSAAFFAKLFDEVPALLADAGQAGERSGKTWDDCNDDEKRARLRKHGGRR